MRIIHVTDYLWPDFGYQEWYLAYYQALQGHCVYIVTSTSFTPWNHQLSDRVINEHLSNEQPMVIDNVQIIRLQTSFEYSHRTWLQNLSHEIKTLEPDFIHIHGFANFNSVRIAYLKYKGLIPNCQVIVDDHMIEVASIHPYYKLFYRYFRYIFKAIYSQMKAIVAVSEETKSFMVNNYTLPYQDVHVIPLGVDTKRFYYDSDARLEIRTRLGIAKSDIVYIYAGKMNETKGPHLLIEAGLKIMDLYENIHLLLVGSGANHYMRLMHDLIVEPGVSRRIHWQNVVPSRELYRYYSAADVGVWPRESSITMIEAQACGLPIIVCDMPITRERTQGGKGLIYRLDDVDDLCRKMLLLREDSELRYKIKSVSQDYVINNLSWEKLSKQFLQIGLNDEDMLHS